MKELKIRCPNCNQEAEVEEVLINAVVTQRVTLSLVDGQIEAEYGDREVLSGDVEQYQCFFCGGYLADDMDGLQQLIREQSVEQKQDLILGKYGPWGDHPTYHVEDWMEEASNNDTRLGYWDWVYAKIESNQEKQ